jgi:hypothetical protein
VSAYNASNAALIKMLKAFEYHGYKAETALPARRARSREREDVIDSEHVL